MNKVVYKCQGSCGAEISEQDYEKGLVVCGTKECNLKGQPFKKMFKCLKCGEYFEQNQQHKH